MGDVTNMTGNFIAHMIPAGVLLFTGFVWLFLLWLRTRCLNRNAPAIFIHQSNIRIMRAMSVYFVICAFLGMTLYRGLFHKTLAMLFFIPGFAGILESVERLPADSNRAGSVVSLLAAGLLWGCHAETKNNAIDRLIHVLLAQSGIWAAVGFAASMYLSDGGSLQETQREGATEFHLLGILGVLLHGSWMATAGYNAGINAFENIDLIPVYFIWQCVGLGLVTLFVWVPGQKGKRIGFSKLESDEENANVDIDDKSNLHSHILSDDNQHLQGNEDGGLGRSASS